MWLLYTFIHMFLLAFVNYLDEYLTHSSSEKEEPSIHRRVGGVLIMSTITCAIGASGIFLFADNLDLPSNALYLAILSAIPMVLSWASYFYLFQLYSAHQVLPLFGMSSVWLLLIEPTFGASIGLIALVGVFVLMLGAYLIDNGSLKIKAPSKLLLLMMPSSLCWALANFFVKKATDIGDALPVYFWQLVTTAVIGVLMVVFVKQYRRGLLNRIKHEKFKFIGPTVMNEGLSQLAFLASAFAIAAAPLAVYFTAAGGIQSIILIFLLYFFPLDKRNKILPVQFIGIVCIALGIVCLEVGR